MRIKLLMAKVLGLALLTAQSAQASLVWCQSRPLPTQDRWCIVASAGGICTGIHYNTRSECKAACKRIYEKDCIDDASFEAENGFGTEIESSQEF